jgi:hypothetical protein
MRAIPKWEAVALAEVSAGEADPEQMSDLHRYWYEQYVQDQRSLIDETSNALAAGRAVSVMATLENFMGMLCAEYKLKLPDKANWGHKRSGVEGLIKVKFDTLAGFPNAKRARLLGNTFKHAGGKTDEEWVKAHPGTAAGEEIRYADENWQEIVNDVEAFLMGVVKRLPPAK